MTPLIHGFFRVRLAGIGAKSAASLGILFMLILCTMARGTHSATANLQTFPQIKWASLESAANLAAQQNKPLLIEVYTHWCGWCKKMEDETFAHPEVVQYIGANFVAVRIDAESDKKIWFSGREMTCRELAKSVLKISNYPSVVFAHQGYFSVIPGYQKPAELQNYLASFLQKSQVGQ
jgi:thioredoxin-related protein